jgi:hypothetical protein
MPKPTIGQAFQAGREKEQQAALSECARPNTGSKRQPSNWPMIAKFLESWQLKWYGAVGGINRALP